MSLPVIAFTFGFNLVRFGYRSFTKNDGETLTYHCLAPVAKRGP